MWVADSELCQGLPRWLAEKTMSNKKLELTRRRVLGGLGTIGVASTAAGLGTSAYLSDTESFEDNEITAGTLDITVSATGTGDQDGMGPEDGNWYTASSDGDGGAVGMGFEISDLKPGDSYDLCWCIENSGNPAVLRAFIPWESVEYGTTSDEDDAADLPGVESVDDFTNPLGSEHITVSKNLFVCDEGVVDEGENILADDITYEPNDPGGWEWDGGLGNWVSSLSNNDNTSQDGVPIGSHDGVGTKNAEDDEDPLSEGTSDYILVGGTEDAHFSGVAYCMTIDVSPDAGNELQGGTASFNLEFHAQQARHNDHPFSEYMAARPRTDSPTDWDDDYPV